MAPLTPAAAAAIARLRAFKPPPTQFYTLPLTRRAAVLILLFADRRGDLRVVLTVRSAKLKNYAGHVALPGGKADSLTETPFTIARREAFEEIGLPLTDDKLPAGYSVEHLTELPTNLAMTELGVRPCVAYLKASEDHKARDPTRDLLPTLDAKEVAAVFTAPFHNFLAERDEDPEHREVPGKWYEGNWHSWHEQAWRMHQFYVPVVQDAVFKATRSPGRATSGESSDNPAVSDAVVDDQDKTRRRSERLSSKSQLKPSPDLSVSPLNEPRYRVFGMTARIIVDCARVAYDQDPEFEHNSHFGDENMIERLLRIGRLSPIKRPGDRLTKDVMKAARMSSL